jgi:excisionase family DNA binding protein
VASVDAGANRATRRKDNQKKPPAPLPDRLITVQATAIYLGVDTRTVRNMLLDGRLKAYTLGPRTLRIRLSDIDSTLQPYGGANAAT